MKFVEVYVLSIDGEDGADAAVFASEQELLESLWEDFGNADEAEELGYEIGDDGKPVDLATWAAGTEDTGTLNGGGTSVSWESVKLPLDALKVTAEGSFGDSMLAPAPSAEGRNNLAEVVRVFAHHSSVHDGINVEIETDRDGIPVTVHINEALVADQVVGQ